VPSKQIHQTSSTTRENSQEPKTDITSNEQESNNDVIKYSYSKNSEDCDIKNGKTMEQLNKINKDDPTKDLWKKNSLKIDNFFGRESKLNEINDYLLSGEKKSVAVVILSGLGGVGKSQLALEYAYKNEKDFKIIGWLRAENRDSLEIDYINLASSLNILNTEINKEELIITIKTELENRADWLLIFDNAIPKNEFNDLDINNYIPQTKAGCVLVTSRNKNWQNPAKVIEVEVFTPEESKEYIINSLKLDDKNSQKAYELAEELGRLPLALSQACAYIRSTRITISRYLELFNEHPKKIFRENRSKLQDYDETVATTWAISIKAVKKSCPDSVYLLNLCAFMDPENIPINLLKKRSNCLPWKGNRILFNELRVIDALTSLTDYSLVQYENNMLSVHRLVQLITRNNIRKDKRIIWIGSLIRTMIETLPNDINKKEDRDIYYQLLPHLLKIINLAEKNQLKDIKINKNIISLVYKLGTFLFNTSDFKKDIEYQEKILEICQKIGDRKKEADCYTKIGTDYNRLGDYHKDEEYQERSLEICQDIGYRKGESNCYTNLGKAYHNLCDFKKAIEYHKKSLKICQEIDDDQGEANCLINLGAANYRLGYFEEDIKYQNKSIQIWEKIPHLQGESRQHGESKCYTNLGNAYLNLGNFNNAIEYYKMCLKICQKIGDRQGKSTCFNNLGVAYHSLGYYEKNTKSLEKSIRYLNVSQKLFQKIGDREGQTKCYSNLGNVYHSLQDFEKAIQFQKESLKICQKIDDSQGESVCYNNLGNIYHSFNDFKKAIEFQEKSLSICSKNCDLMGKAKCYLSLSKAYQSLGYDSKANYYKEQSLETLQDIGYRKSEAEIYFTLGDIYNRLS